jgi:deoxyribodipyrimidine photolyase
MGEAILLPTSNLQQHSLDSIQQSLDIIHQQLLFELKVKQEAMVHLVEKVTELERVVGHRELKISELQSELEISRQLSDGNRQIVNKLLNDIDRLQQDVSWYKRTYESRSLFGTLKEKLFGSKTLR